MHFAQTSLFRINICPWLDKAGDRSLDLTPVKHHSGSCSYRRRCFAWQNREPVHCCAEETRTCAMRIINHRWSSTVVICRRRHTNYHSVLCLLTVSQTIDGTTRRNNSGTRSLETRAQLETVLGCTSQSVVSKRMLINFIGAFCFVGGDRWLIRFLLIAIVKLKYH